MIFGYTKDEPELGAMVPLELEGDVGAAEGVMELLVVFVVLRSRIPLTIWYAGL